MATRAATAAFAAHWREATPLDGLAHALDRLDRPGADAVAALVRPVLADAAWVRAVVAALVDAAARDPWFDPPLAPVRSAVQAGLTLHAGRHAAIVLGVGALDRLAAHKRRAGGGSIGFSGCATLIRVLDGGGATLSLWRGGWRDGRPIERCAPIGRQLLHDGDLLALDAGTSFLVDHAQRDIVLLHATIFAGAAPTSCEYDRETLALRATGAASEQASRTQMLTSLLGALGRDDTAAFDAASRSPVAHVRWHAMREWLALDTDAAAARLAGMAVDDPDPEVRALAAAPILAALSANSRFLGDIAVEALVCGDDAPGVYGPPVVMLRQGAGNWFLRANLWPAEEDAVLRASGRRAFFYDLPHDHNFSFFTIGHHGPGYESDYWEIDEPPLGLPGEAVALRSIGRRRLGPGEMLLYRAHRDIHAQRPPAAFSVTLNLVEASGREPWRDQYRFDTERGRIAGLLNVTAIEGLLPLAAHLGGGEGADLLHHLALRHPVARLRFGAVRALAAAADGPDARRAILETAARRDDRYVSASAARALADEPADRRWADNPLGSGA